MSSIYNSCDAFHKAPFGAVRAGQAVTFTLRVPAEFGCTAPRLVLHRDGKAPAPFVLHSAGGADGRDLFTITLPMPQPGLYFYYFDLYTGYRAVPRRPWRGLCHHGHRRRVPAYGVRGQVCHAAGHKGRRDVSDISRPLFRGRPKPMPFADRIYRENKSGEPYFWPTEQEDGYLTRDYFGGDFEGIRRKLPYLAGLGVTVLYLNPILRRIPTTAQHGQLLKRQTRCWAQTRSLPACAEAKQQGITVILDGVFSHTGSDSIYFNRECRYPVCGAYNSPKAPTAAGTIFPPSYPCGYRAWWGFDTLPEVNERDESYRQFICGEGGVIDTWLGLGAGGFRLDVADELPDDFIEAIRAAVKRHGEDKYLLGEVWEDATTKFSYGARRTYLLGKGLDAVMNYPFRNAVLDFLRGGSARSAADTIVRICENYPAPALHVLMNFISTHDTERHHRPGGRKLRGKKTAIGKAAAAFLRSGMSTAAALCAWPMPLLFTLPGIPSVYYGDEIGMQGYKDPFNRAYFDWGSTEAHIIPVLKNLSALRRRCPALCGRPSVHHLCRGAACCVTNAAPRTARWPYASTAQKACRPPCWEARPGAGVFFEVRTA